MSFDSYILEMDAFAKLRLWRERDPRAYSSVMHQLGLFLAKMVPDNSERVWVVGRLKELLQTAKDDLAVVEGLVDAYARISTRSHTDSTRRLVRRAKDRAGDILKLLRHLPRTPERILDVGCGDGSILRAVGRRLPGAELMAADLREPADVSGFDFRVCAADRVPFEDDAADLVLLSMSAHHLEHLEATLAELRRVLRPGGAIILREHDFAREADRVFMDLVHLFYACIAGDEETPCGFLKTFWSNYQSKSEWVRVFEKNGFSLTFATKFNKRDIFNSFYAVFTKRTD